VLYRSKETALPDFSKDETLIGEVFFDVRPAPRHHINDLCNTLRHSLTYLPRMVLPR
jgi:hypothetical protein